MWAAVWIALIIQVASRCHAIAKGAVLDISNAKTKMLVYIRIRSDFMASIPNPAANATAGHTGM